jgi:hypothetical protein
MTGEERQETVRTLSTSELDQVLLPVDDGQGAVLVPLSNVSRLEPSVVGDRLARDGLVLVCEGRPH